MNLTITYEQEEDGRWLAEVKELPGTLGYGKDPENAIAHVQALALRVVADQFEHGQPISSVIFSYVHLTSGSAC